VSIEVIEQRLATYNCKNRIEEINALKEISQEIALMALSKADFFKVAEFHGGTALRILYGTQRFSEDLDFALLMPMKHFDLTKYLMHMHDEFEAYGYQAHITDRVQTSKTVQKQFLKIDSLGKELELIYPRDKYEKKIKIKFELDTNPPEGAKVELKYQTFPLAYSIIAKDLPSMFSGKLHALLCRTYDKGRDWYDFIWFISNQTPINYTLLSSAINQQGPWRGQEIFINRSWVIEKLSNKIQTINWSEIVSDVVHLLKPHEQPSLSVWRKEFFLDLLTKDAFKS